MKNIRILLPYALLSTREKLIFYCIAALLSIGYASFLSSLPMDVFLDRQNYLNYVDNSVDLFLFQWELGFLPFIANEPLWLFFNSILSGGFRNPENAVRFYIFLSAGFFAFFVLRHDSRNIVWLLFFLLFPQIIKNYIVHLRQGVAVAVFFAGWGLTGVKKRWFFMALASFIHASFFFIISLLLMKKILYRLNISLNAQFFVFIIFGLFVSASINFLASATGARQAEEYVDVQNSLSGLGFIFWLGIFGLFVLQGKKYISRFSFELIILIFYLTSYFITPVAARIFESALILILLAGLSLRGVGYRVFLVAIFFYAIIYYVMQWNQPWYGFGI